MGVINGGGSDGDKQGNNCGEVNRSDTDDTVGGYHHAPSSRLGGDCNDQRTETNSSDSTSNTSVGGGRDRRDRDGDSEETSISTHMLDCEQQPHLEEPGPHPERESVEYTPLPEYRALYLEMLRETSGHNRDFLGDPDLARYFTRCE